MAGKTPQITASQEDYLEAIGELAADADGVRVGEIARRLGVAMPSVTGAVKALRRRGLVHHDPYQRVTLTAEGRRAAERVASRHRALESFLSGVLGLAGARARETACRMEHAVDDDVLDRLDDFRAFLREQAGGGSTGEAFAQWRRGRRGAGREGA